MRTAEPDPIAAPFRLRRRPAVDADRAFLVALYGSCRADELALIGWTPAQSAVFIEQQFAAREAQYRAAFPLASFDIIECDRHPVGRVVVDRGRDIRLVDIAVLPTYRGRGLARSVMTELIAESDRKGLEITLHVERFNLAAPWYSRLGFEPIAADSDDAAEVYVAMRRQPRLSPSPLLQPQPGAVLKTAS